MIASAVKLTDALREEGFPVPQNCRESRVLMTADTALFIQFEVHLTNEDLVKIGRAMQRVGEGVPK